MRLKADMLTCFYKQPQSSMGVSDNYSDYSLWNDVMFDLLLLCDHDSKHGDLDKHLNGVTIIAFIRESVKLHHEESQVGVFFFGEHKTLNNENFYSKHFIK